MYTVSTIVSGYLFSSEELCELTGAKDTQVLEELAHWINNTRNVFGDLIAPEFPENITLNIDLFKKLKHSQVKCYRIADTEEHEDVHHYLIGLPFGESRYSISGYVDDVGTVPEVPVIEKATLGKYYVPQDELIWDNTFYYNL